uniref:LysR substrate-binding domain-containing protein n=1 Tax=uncultured Caballeronia sp. TaxID=1827198 RepID=UPI0035CCAA10
MVPVANDYSRFVAWNVYDRLVSHGTKVMENGALGYDVTVMKPELAESWDIQDGGKTIIFHLRKDATFHDGSPVTADDVKWSFDRAVTVGGFATVQMGAGSMTKPEQFSVVDPHTFKMTFDQPNKLTMPDLVVPILNGLQESNPGLSIEIVEDTSARMLSMLDEGRLDLVVGRSIVSDEPSKYHYQPLGDEPLSVVVGYDHPPFPPHELSFADLAGHRWVTYPSSMPMQAMLAREMDLAGAQVPMSAISTASTFVTVALLQCSADLVSVLPAGVARLFCKHRMLRAVPIDFKSRSQTFGIVTRRVGVLSPMGRLFVEMAVGRGVEGA